MSRNWSSAYAPLTLEPRPSPRLRRLFIALTVFFAVCPWLTTLPAFAALVLGGFATVSLVTVWCRRVELGGAPLVVHWGRDGEWRWRSAGRDETVRLRGDSVVLPWLVILNFDGEGSRRRFSLMLLEDNLDPQLLRRLRVRLRYEAANAGGPKEPA